MKNNNQEHGRSLHEYRADYALKRFEEEGIRYMRPDENSDRFFVWSKDNTRKYTFFAGSGQILGAMPERGIENMITLACGGRDGLVQA